MTTPFGSTDIRREYEVATQAAAQVFLTKKMGEIDLDLMHEQDWLTTIGVAIRCGLQPAALAATVITVAEAMSPDENGALTVEQLAPAIDRTIEEVGDDALSSLFGNSFRLHSEKLATQLDETIRELVCHAVEEFHSNFNEIAKLSDEVGGMLTEDFGALFEEEYGLEAGGTLGEMVAERITERFRKRGAFLMAEMLMNRLPSMIVDRLNGDFLFLRETLDKRTTDDDYEEKS